MDKTKADLINSEESPAKIFAMKVKLNKHLSEYLESKICKNCKHWGYEEPDFEKDKVCSEWGVFVGANEIKGQSVFATHDGSVFHGEEWIKDEVVDSVIKEIWLCTNENFGCIKWEEKDGN